MDQLTIAIIGLLVGIVGGMFGIGGSIILIPALTEFRGPNQHLYQATAMIMNFFVSVPAVYQHWRARAIDAGTIIRLVPLSIVFVAVGVAVSESRVFAGSGEAYLRGLFGVFLFACGLAEIYRAYRPRSTVQKETADYSQFNAAPALTLPTVAAIAAPTGFVSGLLGIGGGTLGVPLQRRFLHMPLPIAIANSTALVAATAIFGGIIKNYAYYSEHGTARQPILLAAILAPTAILGSLIGARLTHRVQLKTLRTLFIILLMVASIRLINGAISAP